MSYKPNFCAECGEKIERVEWKPWTSRRFCEDCAATLENSIRWKTGIAAVGVLVVGIFAGQINRITQKPVALTNAQTLVSNAASLNQAQKNVNQLSTALSNSPANLVVQTSPTQTKLGVNHPPVVAVETEAAYYCGAKTQKGTICTRRVKGGGRCWQHIGKSAMLPQERLLIQSN
ncbi:MAG: hypothetical protein ABI954_05185 [Pyrinomonadaceae bacterium]